jgi:hypothetical protein
MKCEIKLLDKSVKGLLKDTITHPKQNALLWFKCFLIAGPVVLINEVITPKNDYICIGALIVCGIVLIIALHQKCKPIRDA